MPPWDIVEALGTWFAGVATAGSFWLGFSILRSDRKKEERSQALRFLIWSSVISRPEWGGPQLVVSVWNRSDQSIFLPMLIGNPRDVGRGKLFPSKQSGVLEPQLRPGHESEAHVPLGSDYRVPEGLRVTFSDARGTEWVYELDGGGLRKPRREKRAWPVLERFSRLLKRPQGGA
jgi:hypothetical protein